MTDPYVEWIKSRLDRNPRLSRAGLARHLRRHRSVVTKMLQGERSIKVSEMPLIEGYLGARTPQGRRASGERRPVMPPY